MDYKEHKIRNHSILLPNNNLNVIEVMIDYVKDNINNLDDPTFINYLQNPKVYKVILKNYELDTIINIIPLIKSLDDDTIDFIASIIVSKSISNRNNINCHKIDNKLLYKILLSVDVVYYHPDKNKFYIPYPRWTPEATKFTNHGYISFINPDNNIDEFILQNPYVNYYFIDNCKEIKYEEYYAILNNQDLKLKEELNTRNSKLNQSEVKNQSEVESTIIEVEPHKTTISIKRPLWKRIISQIIGIK
jgi:hypothetical protein